MDRWTDGIVALNESFIIFPGYSFNDFKRSAFYTGQDGSRIITLDGFFYFDNHKFLVELSFIKEDIYSVSLLCCDVEIPFEAEEERRKLHDEILQEHGLNRENEYSWGKIISDYDARGNVSSIDFIYSLRK